GFFGGGIGNFGGTVTVTQTAFTVNTAGANGGGIHNLGAMMVTHSTFSGNSATNHGGGIDNSGTATVTGNMFTRNSAGSGNGGLNNEPGGLLTQFDNQFMDDQLSDVFP